jgi:hypothetical protein
MQVVDIVNKVMKRLREPTIVSLTESSYAMIVTEFVADIHEELLDYDWSSMQHTMEVPVDSGQRVLDLSRLESNGGDVLAGSRVSTINSIPLWVKYFNSSNTTNDPIGFDVDISLPEDVEQTYYDATNVSTGVINEVAFRGNPSRDGLEAILYPTSAARHLRIRMWTPEAVIDTTNDASREVLVPWKPLYLGALYLALNERGEEIGEPGGLAEKRYINAVDRAKEADMKRKANADLYVAERV